MLWMSTYTLQCSGGQWHTNTMSLEERMLYLQMICWLCTLKSMQTAWCEYHRNCRIVEL